MTRRTFLLVILSVLMIGSCKETPIAEKEFHINDDVWFEHDLKLNQAIKEDLESRELFNKLLYEGEAGFDFSLYGNNQSTVIYQGVPYARYWQMKDKKAYVLHPMVFGRYLYNSAETIVKNDSFSNILSKIGYQLEDKNTLAFYYPEYYPLSRMTGPEIVYSAISQSEILAGFMQLARHDTAYSKYVHQCLSGLLYDYYSGGVNLSNKTLLELPLFRSSPEIILNGWLHALLHLNDYCKTYPDSNAAAILKQNLKFLSKHLDIWYDEKLGISKYSDLCPYEIDLNYLKLPGKELKIRYRSKEKSFRNVVVKPALQGETEFGIFDNYISSNSGGDLELYVNVSAFYETLITSDQPFQIKLKTGTYDPLRATQNRNGKAITLTSYFSKSDQQYVVDLEEVKPELFCGYPTNFSKKNGKNYYHVQHIVALLYLANYVDDIDRVVKEKLIATAKHWYLNTTEFKYVDISSFETPQKVLDGILRGKFIVDTDSASTLFAKSNIQQVW